MSSHFTSHFTRFPKSFDHNYFSMGTGSGDDQNALNDDFWKASLLNG